jgi:dolichyl-phosphate beta-glucosyltransferase
MPRISAVVPVYNEAICLEASLRELAGYLEGRYGADHEIVAVDDGSRDGSLAMLRDLSRELRLRILENTINLGKGASVRRGMLEAVGDASFFTDADLSTPLSELERFEPLLAAGNAVVIGTRKHPDAAIEQSQGALRTWMGLGYTKLVNSVLGLDLSDYTCGFKLFRRDAAQAIFSRSVIDGWSFDAEILFLAKRLGFKVAEVPVRWIDRPDSKVRLVRDTARSFAELIGIRLRAARGGYGP